MVEVIETNNLDLLQQVMVEAWDGAIPAEEIALARALPADRVSLGLARLKAVLSVEHGGSVGAAAASLSMDRIAFFRMRQRWSKHRSLRTLVPFAGRAARKVGAGRENEARLATEMLAVAARPLNLSRLASDLRAKSGSGMSRQTAMRLVRAAAAMSSMGVEEIAHELGEKVLVDFAGTAMSVEGQVVAVCLVVETATRFILGAAAGTIAEMPWLLLDAMNDAIAIKIDVLPSSTESSLEPGRIQVVLPPVAEPLAVELGSAGSSTAIWLAQGKRRFGRGLVDYLGHRIGRMSLHPRAISTGQTPNRGIAPARQLDMADARAFVVEAVRDHNMGRCSLLLKAVEAANMAKAKGLRADMQQRSPERSFVDLITAFEPWHGGARRLAGLLAELRSVTALLRDRLMPR